MADSRDSLVVAVIEAEAKAAKAKLELERNDLQREQEWLERHIDEERARLERG